jgi:hypothetical protein
MPEIELYYHQLLMNSGLITGLLTIIPILFAIFYWKYPNKHLKFFFTYLVIRLSFNILVELFIWSSGSKVHYYTFWKPYLDYWKIDNTLFTTILFRLDTFIFLGLCYFAILPNDFLRKHKGLLVSALSIISIIIYVFVDGYHSDGFVNSVLESIFIIWISFSYLRHLYQSNLSISIQNHPFFWISIGLLFPSLISLIFQFIIDKLLASDFVLYCKAHIVSNVFEVIGQGFYVVGFTKAKYLRFLERS